MGTTIYFLFFLPILISYVGSELTNKIDDEQAISLNSLVFWPKGIVPFYVEEDQFDAEQTLDIMRAINSIMFKSCLKFQLVLARPEKGEHVLVFENPTGTKKCVLNTEPHSTDEPHRVPLGYDCMHSPHIEMVIMRALGFPFEHNRVCRDSYIDVQPENVEPGYIELFTKDLMWPEELRKLPYDRSSVMHFGEREFSKNGHKTIVFKDGFSPERIGLTSHDIKKIRIVYEEECKIREMEVKKEECKNYAPSLKRKKRGTAIPYRSLKSLRVNPDITPPPSVIKAHDSSVPAAKDKEEKKAPDGPIFRTETVQGYTDAVVKELGIEREVEDLVAQVHRVGAAALEKAREKYCNGSKPSLRSAPEMEKPKDVNILGIIHDTASYAKSLVSKAIANLTELCEASKSIDDYQRASCPFFNKNLCRQTYKSTKPGPVKVSTQHRPVIKQSTKHQGFVAKNIYESLYRSGNNTEEPDASVTTAIAATTTVKRKKRNAVTEKVVTTKAPRTFPDIPMVSKSDLRMGTRVSIEKKGMYMPNYRTSNDTHEEAAKERRKRSAEVTQGGKRGFERQRFRAHKRPRDRNRGDYVKSWDSSKLSMEKSHKRQRRPRQRSETPEPEQMDYEAIESASKKSHKKKFRLVPVPRTVELSKKNAEFYNERKWPDNIVRYFIKENGQFNIDDVRNRLGEVNDILRAKTCVRIEEIREDDMEKYEDFLVLDNSPDYVTGRVGGKQNFGVMELLNGGQHRQHAAMMVMAMLGFYFEVARHDRDKHIRVHMRHVRPDKLHHFEKIREDATFDLPYDYKSATHPAWQFWRQIGRTGISTVATFKETDPDGFLMKSLGQNEELLSELDLVKINSVYGTECFEDSAAEQDASGDDDPDANINTETNTE